MSSRVDCDERNLNACGQQGLFVISNPDVYKSVNSDCYIVFGEAKVCSNYTSSLYRRTDSI